MVSSVFQNNLNDHNKSLLNYRYQQGYYTGNVIDTGMKSWYDANCKG